ncbi:hypothetical protein HK103_004703 [Boothiomyces macroporosus]|uniref:Uncharacterized protein n=1 Tax=Boothiomyces macroporosus TaxID=261099 RepID=A0AAD5YB12_9FUNG|nr:hypothetical protein HK103_004703 [Boothiomyces macroporosus]
MYPRLKSLPQKKTHTLPLNLYEPLPFPYQCPFPQYIFPQGFYDAQATAIQKVFKGYQTRKRYVNTKLNPITKSKEPDQYYTEVILFEIIKEFSEAALVELCLSSYYPISNTREMKALIMLEHIVKEIIHDTCGSMIKRVEAIDIYDDLISEIVLETIDEALYDQIKGYLTDTKMDMIMDIVFQDFIKDCTFDSLNDISAENELEEFINENILETVQEFLTRDTGKSITTRRSKPKSAFFDRNMDDLLEKFLMEELTKHLVPQSKNKLEDEMDMLIMEALFKSL